MYRGFILFVTFFSLSSSLYSQTTPSEKIYKLLSSKVDIKTCFRKNCWFNFERISCNRNNKDKTFGYCWLQLKVEHKRSMTLELRDSLANFLMKVLEESGTEAQKDDKGNELFRVPSFGCEKNVFHYSCYKTSKVKNVLPSEKVKNKEFYDFVSNWYPPTCWSKNYSCEFKLPNIECRGPGYCRLKGTGYSLYKNVAKKLIDYLLWVGIPLDSIRSGKVRSIKCRSYGKDPESKKYLCFKKVKIN